MFGLGIELRSEVHRTAWSLPISTQKLGTCYPRFPTFANHRLSVLGIHEQRLSAEPHKVFISGQKYTHSCFSGIPLHGTCGPSSTNNDRTGHQFLQKKRIERNRVLVCLYTASEHGYMSRRAFDTIFMLVSRR
jgi:hypothetical protein